MGETAPRRSWWGAAGVLAIDLGWSSLVGSAGRALFLSLYPREPGPAQQLLEGLLIPSLWISYLLLLAGQLTWVSGAGAAHRRWEGRLPLPQQRRRLRRSWWVWGATLVALVLALHGWRAQALPEPDPAGVALLLGVLLGDLLLIFWLPTALLLPEQLRPAVPLGALLAGGQRGRGIR
ncbi:MAG: hypothetical protein VKK62_06620 [Synechococcaceae cyanobacterium]|nr:hypothetical protein [Synechococcaceae cyanobacterium]